MTEMLRSLQVFPMLMATVASLLQNSEMSWRLIVRGSIANSGTRPVLTIASALRSGDTLSSSTRTTSGGTVGMISLTACTVETVNTGLVGRLGGLVTQCQITARETISSKIRRMTQCHPEAPLKQKISSLLIATKSLFKTTYLHCSVLVHIHFNYL